VDEPRSTKPRKIEEDVARRIDRLAENGELRGLPGEGKPIRDDDRSTDDGWAARHVMRQAEAVPAWVDLRKEIDDRRARIKRRLTAHREWMHDRTRFLAELPAERIVDASHATAARDQSVRGELERAVGELNALIRRYDLLVVPALQIPLVTLERIASD
jgi:Asp-tRNA(Asn)/Glu-tRNA(Gln) amidotransferase A subunit family amidase